MKEIKPDVSKNNVINFFGWKISSLGVRHRLHKVISSLIWTLFLFFALNFSTAQSATEILQKTLSQKSFESAELGIYIKNLSTNNVLLSHQENKALIPASILKIRTVNRAMAFLGSDHRFKTAVYFAGEIDQGVYYGDIVIKGFGDPTFGSRADGAVLLEDVSKEVTTFLRKNNITCIYGTVVADASFLDLPGIPSGYIEEDIANYYGAGAYGINIQDNAYEIVFERLQNNIPRIKKFDSLAVSFVTSSVVARGYSDQAYIFDHPDQHAVYIIGQIPSGLGEFKIKGAIKNPPLYCAQKLQHMLAESEIEFHEYPRVSWQPYLTDAEIIWEANFESPELWHLLKPILHKSNNVYAEILHRLVLKKEGSANNKPPTKLDDGSGLSPTNRITAKALMSDLQQLVDANYASLFIEQLPQNGLDGTVKSVLRDRKASLYIKSGSIGGVRSYMGLRKSKSGDWIGFVCMANDVSGNGSASRKAWEILLDWVANQ